MSPLCALCCCSPTAATSVDGKHLALALQYVTAEAAKDSGAGLVGRVDLGKVAVGGFSMGGAAQ